MSSVALLVIDIQQAAFDGVFVQPIDRAADLVANARTLIDAAHAAGQPVIFVQHCDAKGEPFEEGTPHWQFHEQLTPQAGDLVVKKHASSAFENTDLQAKLDALEARDVVVCGLQSDFCVSNTSKSALSLGYRVRVASDGHSTWDLDGETAKAISERVNGELQSLGAVLEPTARIANGFAAAARRSS
jgi:nicotinamidase-related amidase